MPQFSLVEQNISIPLHSAIRDITPTWNPNNVVDSSISLVQTAYSYLCLNHLNELAKSRRKCQLDNRKYI